MSTKLDTPASFKKTVSWIKGYNVIISLQYINNKISSRDYSCTVEVARKRSLAILAFL